MLTFSNAPSVMQYDSVWFPRRHSILSANPKLNISLITARNREFDDQTGNESPRNMSSLFSSLASTTSQILGLDDSISSQALANLLFALQSEMEYCRIHPTIIYQTLSSLSNFINVELFNQIMLNNCSRNSAQLIQVNLSTLEEEYYSKQDSEVISDIFNREFKPTKDILKFLQIATALQDLSLFKDCVGMMKSLHISQIHQAMFNYKFEVLETSFSDEIQHFVQEELNSELKSDISSQCSALNPLLVYDTRRFLKIPNNMDDGFSSWHSFPLIHQNIIKLIDSKLLRRAKSDIYDNVGNFIAEGMGSIGRIRIGMLKSYSDSSNSLKRL